MPKPATHLARWSGTKWTALGKGVGPDDGMPSGSGNHAHSITGWDSSGGTSSLYAAGMFQKAGNLAATNVARWGCRSSLTVGVSFELILADVIQGTRTVQLAVEDDGDGLPEAVYCGDERTALGPGANVAACGRRFIVGTRGNDAIFLAASATRAVVFGGPGDDRITGSPFADIIFGGDGDDAIDAGNGEDEVLGDRGRDTLGGGHEDDALSGGPGADILEGGPDRDLFGADAEDRVTDLSPEDELRRP